MAKILIACETSGIVREAFRALGHDATSCDLLAADDGSNHHIRDDVRRVIAMERWDFMMVAHPPCTRLCNAGARWLIDPPKQLEADHYPADIRAEFPKWSREEKLKFMWDGLENGAALFSDLWNADIPRVAIENPIMHKHAKARIAGYQKPSQTVQPWQFGHDEAGPDNVKKRTCLWLRNVPNLVATGSLDGSTARAEVHEARSGPDRWKRRSKFYYGIAGAMADQWGRDLPGGNEYQTEFRLAA